jgi:hypothetical protein
MKQVISFLQQHWYQLAWWGLTVVCVTFIGLLLARNPFSLRTLIPNFEPFPDSFHYLVPAKNLAQSRGLYFWRPDGANFKPSVPPLYSLIIAPIFLVQSDPRWFYLMNILLSFGGLFIFWKITNTLFHRPTLSTALVFVMGTLFHWLWLPNLVMAENLLIFLVLVAIWLFILPAKGWRLALLAALAVAIYATKYAAAPLTVVIGFSALGKTWAAHHSKLGLPQLHRDWWWVIGGGLLALALFVLWQQIVIGSSIFSQLLSLMGGLFNPILGMLVKNNGTGGPATIASASSFFSTRYFSTNFPRYWDALLGGHQYFLWDSTPLWPRWLALGGISGLLFGLFCRRWRALSALLLAMMIAQIAFMSTFYANDTRYIAALLPIPIIGLGMALEVVWLRSTQLMRQHQVVSPHMIEFVLSVLLVLAVVLSGAGRFRKQLALNFKYAETPWWYVAITEYQRYFNNPANQVSDGSYFITASIPYQVDFFGVQHVTLLPLSDQQDFREEMKEVWGNRNYSDLLALYHSYLQAGKNVYVSNWGLGNVAVLKVDWEAIVQNFQLTEVQNGCMGSCNIYRVETKTKLNIP